MRGIRDGGGGRWRPDLADAGDVQLLARGAAGFDVFYRRHHHFVLRYIGRRVGDPEVALDLTSEVFAAAYLHRGRFDPERGPARAWLVGIARNKMAHHARGEHAASEARRRLGLEYRPPSDAALAEAEALIAAAGILSDLPPAQQDAIWTRHVLDRPYDEMAAAAGVQEATIRKRVSIGLRALARGADA